MICKLKTLKGDTFDLECAPDMLIGAVKEKACADPNGAKNGWEAAGMKLIYQGKVLDDGKDLASYSISENDFMVVMYTKPKKPAAAASAPTAAAPAATAPAAATTTEAAPAPAAATEAAPAPAAASPAPAPAAAQPAARQFSPEAQAAIDNLIEMGYGKDDVEAAMVAAFMNPDRAVQYLEEGLPDAGGDDAMEDEGDDAGPTPTTWPELVNNRQFQREIGAITDQGSLQAYLGQLASADPQKLSLIQANPQAFSQLLNAAAAARAGGGGGGGGAPAPAAAPLPFGAAAPPGGGGGGGGGGLPPGLQQMLAQNPQMLEGLLQNPEMLAQLMQVPEVQQAMQNPEVMEQLGVSPEMMQAMMGGLMGGGGMGGGGGGGGVNPVLAQLTPEDEEAIERLMALGFPRPIVIQAFLACEKNENLAANFLFDQGGDLM